MRILISCRKDFPTIKLNGCKRRLCHRDAINPHRTLFAVCRAAELMWCNACITEGVDHTTHHFKKVDGAAEANILNIYWRKKRVVEKQFPQHVIYILRFCKEVPAGYFTFVLRLPIPCFALQTVSTGD